VSAEEEPPRRIARTGDGRIAVRLAARERQILGALAADLARAAAGDLELEPDGVDDPGLARLRPDAVKGDPEASAAFRELTAADLEETRQERLATLASTLDATSLDEGQAGAWMGAVNDLRLVLGTRLGVTEDIGLESPDERDPAAGDTIVFLWLGWVEEQLVDALAAGLPTIRDAKAP
jgi:Domain of unknown function (DUF2017)